MAHACVRFLVAAFTLGFSLSSAAQDKPAVPQTPRLALLEMLSGDDQAVMKHLTVELQQMIAGRLKEDLAKRKPDKSETSAPPSGAESKSGPGAGAGNGMVALRSLGFPNLAAMGKSFKTFESGPVLFTLNEPPQKQKVEARIESDDLSGDLDHIQLSFHVFNDDQEETIPYMPGITLEMKRQENIWRLNKISAAVDLPVGDPKFFESLAGQSKIDHHANHISFEAMPDTSSQPVIQPVNQTVAMLGFAEGEYARKHPEIGFTCSLADLVGDHKDAFSRMLDPKIATGPVNGYRFNVSGCNGTPADTFHITAEPVTPGNGSKSYCVDPTGNVRSSSDGSGANCLSSGKLTRDDPS
jgi:hypothetical protein